MRIVWMTICLLLISPTLSYAEMSHKEFKETYNKYKEMRFVYKYNKRLLHKLKERIDAGEHGLNDKFEREKGRLITTRTKRDELAGKLGIGVK